jgi:hypothetical protein
VAGGQLDKVVLERRLARVVELGERRVDGAVVDPTPA